MINLLKTLYYKKANYLSSNTNNKNTNQEEANETKIKTLLKSIIKEPNDIADSDLHEKVLVKININDAVVVCNEGNSEKLDYYEKPNNLLQITNTINNINMKCNILKGKLRMELIEKI